MAIIAQGETPAWIQKHQTINYIISMHFPIRPEVFEYELEVDD